LERPQVVIANKMDLPEAQENLKRFKAAYPDLEVFETITLSNQGLEEVIYRTMQLLETTPDFILDNLKEDGVHYKFIPEEEPFVITRVGDHVWRLTGERIERMYKMSDFSTESSIQRFSRSVRLLGVDDALRKAGAIDGDRIQLVDTEFLFVE
jgi:GTP-binding protein